MKMRCYLSFLAGVWAAVIFVGCSSGGTTQQNVCEPNPCTEINKTKCAEGSGGSYTCLCDSGFHDDNGTCVENEVCQANSCSGHGNCDDSDGVITCHCSLAYAGDDCSECAAGYQDDDQNGTCEPIVAREPWCRLQQPLVIYETPEKDVQVVGRVFLSGITDRTSGNDPDSALIGAVGYGSTESMPQSWTNWFNAEPNPGWDGNAVNPPEPDNDEYIATFKTPEGEGDYSFVYRFSNDGGNTWLYCDKNTGVNGEDGSENGYQPQNAGFMTVTAYMIHPECEQRGGACTHVNDFTSPCPWGSYAPFSGEMALCPTGSIQKCCVPNGGYGSPCHYEMPCEDGGCLSEQSGYPEGGFCPQICEPGIDSCPPWSTCIPVFFSAAMGACMLSCNHDGWCRDGWSCQAFPLMPFDDANKDTTYVCWQTGIDQSLAGLSEPCDNDTDCLSGLCRATDNGTQMCVALCGEEKPCLPGFDCLDLQVCTNTNCKACFRF
jgi:hypothetical protein